MDELGLAVPFWLIVLAWIAKVIVLSLICSLLAWLGIRVLDALTPHIHQRQRIGESPVATGLFVAGFMILVGLVIHGSTSAYSAVGVSVVEYVFNFRVWAMVAVSFLISLLIGIALFHIINRLTPKIPFMNINKNPLAVGIYVFGYLLFFGLILHAALTSPFV